MIDHYRIPMDAVCAICDKRFGMHRVLSFRCPNPQWRPGNGQKQWLESTFERKAGRGDPQDR